MPVTFYVPHIWTDIIHNVAQIYGILVWFGGNILSGTNKAITCEVDVAVGSCHIYITI